MHVRRALALALVVPLLLAGCTEDDPKPKMPDPPTTSSTPTPTVTETPEAESAEDFIRRWQAAGDEAQTTGETEQYRELTNGCEPCDGFADAVDKIYSAAGRIEFGGSTVERIKRDGPASDAFKVDVRSSKATIIDSEGSDPRQLTGGVLSLHVFLKEDGSSWLVRHYTILPSS